MSTLMKYHLIYAALLHFPNRQYAVRDKKYEKVRESTKHHNQYLTKVRVSMLLRGTITFASPFISSALCAKCGRPVLS